MLHRWKANIYPVIWTSCGKDNSKVAAPGQSLTHIPVSYNNLELWGGGERKKTTTTTKASDPQLPCQGESSCLAVTWGMLVFSNHYTNWEEEGKKTEGGVWKQTCWHVLTCILLICLTDLTSTNLSLSQGHARLGCRCSGWWEKKS